MDSTQSRFHLQVVTNTITALDDVGDALIDVLGAGADTVQLRDHAASPAQATALVGAIEREVPDARNRLVLHESLIDPGTAVTRWRHLRGASIVSPMGACIPGDSSFGASVHSLAEARMAVDLGAAYLTFGHVFRTGSHPGTPPRGIESLAEVVAAVDVPVLAIGGITPDTLDRVLATGCSGVAVISAVFSQPDPSAATRRLRELLDGSPHHPRHPFPELTRSQPKGTP